MADGTRQYTTQALTEKFLPSNYNSPTTILDATAWGVVLDESSRLVDMRLRSRYVRFNSTADTVVCPKEIQNIATRLAAANALHKLAVSGYNSALMEEAARHEEWADKALERLASGSDSICAEAIASNETLSFTTTATEYTLPITEAFINVEAQCLSFSDSGEEVPTVIRESVRVTLAGFTGYKLGQHFDIYFNPFFQRWVFQDVRGAIRGETSPTITYRWSYERWNQAPQPGKLKSGRLSPL